MSALTVNSLLQLLGSRLIHCSGSGKLNEDLLQRRRLADGVAGDAPRCTVVAEGC